MVSARGVVNYLGLSKDAELLSEMPSMEPATGARALCRTASEVVHHPDRELIFVNILDSCNLFSVEIYSQYMYI